MKVYVNRQPINRPWGGGAHFVNALHKYLPEKGHEIVRASTSITPNVVFLAGLDNDGTGVSVEQAISYKSFLEATNSSTKLILRVNENDARKNTSHVDKYLMKLFPHMDGIVFVSKWLQGYFRDLGWSGKNDAVIINGVDKEVFKPNQKLNDGKLNIVAHHWSDNPLKGFDIYEKLDEYVGKNSDKVSFTYIGRDRGTFKNTKLIRPLHGKELGEELGKYDFYVSASRWDPGPNHVLESIACGLPTYVHKDGGGAVEFAGQNATFSSFGQLEMIINTHLDIRAHSLNAVNSFVPSNWETCINEYTKFMETTCQAT